ncbi:MAG TPA: stage II sporulation protein R [Clostridiales bacterium]|nr:stage II sporulation protein R [Clostridiales bacterium]
MKRWELSLIIGMILAVIFTSFGAFGAECRQVSRQVLRLHVLANSDSPRDQELKLKVRDAVLEGTSDLFQTTADKETLMAQAREYLPEIESIAANTLRENGSSEQVKAELVYMYFETRDYGDITLPAGYYDAVRLTIGDGKGQNWWCVMFPPMCIPAATASPLPLEEQLTHLGEETQYVPRFAVVELIESLMAEEDASPSDEAATTDAED